MPEIIHSIPRKLLEKYFGDDPRLLAAFEDQSAAVEAAYDTATGSVKATDSMQNATVITLSANTVFNNEFILSNGDGTALDVAEGGVSIRVDNTVPRTNNQSVKFNAPGGVILGLPVSGTLVSDTSPSVMYNKTLEKPVMTGIVDAPDNTTAASLGVPLWGVYRDGSVLRIRYS